MGVPGGPGGVGGRFGIRGCCPGQAQKFDRLGTNSLIKFKSQSQFVIRSNLRLKVEIEAVIWELTVKKILRLIYF